jgi:hypothetical protein
VADVRVRSASPDTLSSSCARSPEQRTSAEVKRMPQPQPAWQPGVAPSASRQAEGRNLASEVEDEARAPPYLSGASSYETDIIVRIVWHD